MAFFSLKKGIFFEGAGGGDRMNKLGKIIRKSAAALVLTLVISAVADMSGITAYAAMTGTVTCDLLNVRSGGSMSAPVVGTVSRGTVVDIIEHDNGWFKINMSNGSVGYVSSVYVSINNEGNVTTVTTAHVNVSVLNLRKEPSTNSPILTTLKLGDSVGASPSVNGWSHVISPNSEYAGYVRSEYISAGHYTGNSSTGSSNVVTPTLDYGVCNTAVLNVRSDASTSASIMGYILNGTKVKIIGTIGDWYKVETVVGGSGVVGYVYGSYITVGSSSGTTDNGNQTQTPATGEGVCNTSALNIRKEATTAAATYGLIKQGDKVTILAKSGDWYQVKTTVYGVEVTGYAHASYITVFTSGSDDSTSDSDASTSGSVSAVTPASGTGVCNTDVLNVRKGASTSSTILGVIYQNNTVTITGECGDWYQVKTTASSGAIEGYVFKTYIDKKETSDSEPEQTAPVGPTVTEVNEVVWATAVVNIRKDSNTSAGIISTLRTGASVTRTGVLSNGWSRVSYNGVTAYICSDYLTTTNPNPGDSTDNSQGSSGITGVTGEEVAAYAKQWVGYPYVWGGNNLSTGVDCSGFTQQVYLHFGIQLNRVADAQRVNGIPVTSVNEAKAGDLFFYGDNGRADHVALYLGDGTVIHASHAEVGIIISPVNYRNPFAIVRVIY